MNFIIGVVVVLGCVISGYVLHHGNIAVLWQPTEVLIIGGAAVGSFIIGSLGKTLKDVLKGCARLLKGSPYKKKHYIELLTMLYASFKMMRSKGMLEIEQHIENPHDSSLFNSYPSFAKNHHAIDFYCDYLRLMTMGIEDFYQLEDLMDKEITVHKKHGEHIAHVINSLSESMPALGIVAAVLGVIVTMGSIAEPPEILGELIGAALVGTFLGILMSYGLVGPMGRYIGESLAEEVAYLKCIQNALLSHLRGNSPAVSVEFARTSVGEHEKPSFTELEDACGAVS